MNIGIIGYSGDVSLPHIQRLKPLISTLVRRLVEKNVFIYTGGRDGVMELIFRYANAAGGKVVAVLPSGSDIANGHIIIDTGLDMMGRSITLVRSVDVVIAIGGGAGTLVEMFMANSYGRPLFIARGTGEWTDRLAEVLLDSQDQLLCADGTYTLDSRRRDIRCGVVISSGVYSPDNPKAMTSEILDFIRRFTQCT